jgi:predicted lipid-binding transport protein (Tim44 family)
MNKQGLSAAIPPHWWERLKGAQFGFIAGILIGLIFGWIFHGIISLAVRFGILIVLLLPLIVIGWLWFRSRRPTQSGPGGQPMGMQQGSWTAVIDVERPAPRAPRNDDPSREFIDVPLVRPRAETRPDDIEAELDALKRQQERGS